MRAKDVKKGKRVRVIADSDNLIPIGAVGTLIESLSPAPHIDLSKSI